MPNVPRHDHPEYWTEREHERYEDRVAKAVDQLREDVNVLSSRFTWLMGGLAVLTFLLTILAPMIRIWLGAPQ